MSTEQFDEVYSDPLMSRSKLYGKFSDIFSLGMVIMAVICDKCQPHVVKRKVSKILSGKFKLMEDFSSHKWPEEVIFIFTE